MSSVLAYPLDLDIPDEALPHRLDIRLLVYPNRTPAGGLTPDKPKPAYSAVPSLVVSMTAKEQADLWQRRGFHATHTVYMGRSGGALPALTREHQVVFGKRPDGSDRTFEVVDTNDIVEQGVLLQVAVREIGGP